ncbi:MAG TPA: thioredoxin domain-containing protein [Bryobacteraceae bacterium]|nr:thioredoxin domain-containing protein [Bryobacteraceae bacterium]
MPFRKLALTTLGALALFAAETAPVKKSALDKATLEAYVRHVFVWNAQVKVEIGDPKPSELPGFSKVAVHATQGQASADETLYVSKDGQKIIRGSVFDVAQNPFKPELDKLHTDLQPSMGTPGAPVVIVEFSDFQCPYCKEEAKALRANLLATYPKEVRLYFKDLPLAQIHPWAMPAAIAGRCIFRQNPGAFWDYHDWIYEAQTDVTAENLKSKVLEYVKGKQIDPLQLEHCMDGKEMQAEIDKSIAEAKALGVGGTPTLFVNGRLLTGASAQWASLRAVIDYEIEYQKTAKNAGEDCGCELKLSTPGLK